MKADADMKGAAPYCPRGSMSRAGSSKNSAEQPVLGSNPSTQASNSAEQPAEPWRIWPSSEQVVVPVFSWIPLPFTIDGSIGGSFCHGQYAGHGLRKMVYLLTNGLILKPCKEKDQEPRLFERLQALGLSPKVHASGRCSAVSSAGQPAGIWQAWLCDYAKPLALMDRAAIKLCIPGAVRAMVKAHAGGHILRDNALSKFGMLQGNVVILSASGCESSQMQEGEFTRKVMKQFWSRALFFVLPRDLEEYKQPWSESYRCPLCGRVGMGGYSADGIDVPVCTDGRWACLSRLWGGGDTLATIRRGQVLTVFGTRLGTVQRHIVEILATELPGYLFRLA